jgi:hypothetical protein
MNKIGKNQIGDNSVDDDIIGERELDSNSEADPSIVSSSPKKLTAWLQGLWNNIKSLFTSIADLITKYQAIKGYGGYLAPHDFGSAIPSQEELTSYALEQIKITEPLDIFNATHVKNTWVNPDTAENPAGAQDGGVWVLTNTPNTEPAVFEWINNGPGDVRYGSNTEYGVVKGVEDSGDGSEAGKVTIENFEMRIIGFDGKLDIQQDPEDADKAMIVGPDGRLVPGAIEELKYIAEDEDEAEEYSSSNPGVLVFYPEED